MRVVGVVAVAVGLLLHHAWTTQRLALWTVVLVDVGRLQLVHLQGQSDEKNTLVVLARTNKAFMVWIKLKKSYPNTFAMKPVSADVALDHEVPFFIHLQLNNGWRK